MLIDSHCHLHDREFFTAEQAEKKLLRAHEKGVKKIICIGTDPKDSLAAHDFATKHENVYWTYGVHPANATSSFQRRGVWRLASQGVAPAGRASERDKLVAIGEVGLDYHYEDFDREAQINLFEEMLQLAMEHDLPVSFHIREAFNDFFAVIANFPKTRGVVHSFTDSKKVLKRILNETDFYVGVNGLATYSTLPTPPLDRIILETDAPFLAPVPFRGEINEPAFIREIAEWLSAKLETDFDTVRQQTTKNAEELFNLSN